MESKGDRTARRVDARPEVGLAWVIIRRGIEAWLQARSVRSEDVADIASEATLRALLFCPFDPITDRGAAWVWVRTTATRIMQDLRRLRRARPTLCLADPDAMAAQAHSVSPDVGGQSPSWRASGAMCAGSPAWCCS